MTIEGRCRPKMTIEGRCRPRMTIKDNKGALPPNDDTTRALPPKDYHRRALPPKDDNRRALPPKDDNKGALPPNDGSRDGDYNDVSQRWRAFFSPKNCARRSGRARFRSLPVHTPTRCRTLKAPVLRSLELSLRNAAVATAATQLSPRPQRSCRHGRNAAVAAAATQLSPRPQRSFRHVRNAAFATSATRPGAPWPSAISGRGAHNAQFWRRQS